MYIYIYTVLRIHLSERVGDGCFYHRNKMCLDVFGVLGFRCLTGSALLDCHVLKGFGIYMVGILDS